MDLTILPRIQLELVGLDGNAYAVMGAVKKAARKAGWSREEQAALIEEMTSGDYHTLLATAMKYCDSPVEEEECRWCGSVHCEYEECQDDGKE